MPDAAIETPARSAPLFAFDNSYGRLPERFYARLAPTPVREPQLLRLNETLALDLGLDPARLRTPEGVAALAGNAVPEGADPLAQAYAGHQFGNWVPQLGDGRAILLGEVVARDGVRRDIQLKGSGPTPFSRRGDGRAAIGPVLREYIVSEAMAALGVPTTRTLAAVATGEPVLREQPLPGAVLARVARAHIRVGTFQFFAARGDVEALRALADYAIARLYPHAAQAPVPALALLDAVIARTAALVAAWQQVGFIHGVMNTDNMAIAGETIDYGPCAFMDAYHPGTVYSSIDHGGRYAYGSQPHIAHWNMMRFAQTLLPLLHDGQDAALAAAQGSLDAYSGLFESAWLDGFRRKIGLVRALEGDKKLIDDLLERMAANGADFTLTFRRLADAAAGEDDAVRGLFADPTAFDAWAGAWRLRLADEQAAPAERAAAMRAVNPAFIPRNHRVEAALAAAQADGDLRPFDELMAVLSTPFDDRPDAANYALPPKPGEAVTQTFCGT
jgi:uncharacterized protein YdiU (UPF0061 family)